jgi:hypothetical protein
MEERDMLALVEEARQLKEILVVVPPPNLTMAAGYKPSVYWFFIYASVRHE